MQVLKLAQTCILFGHPLASRRCKSTQVKLARTCVPFGQALTFKSSYHISSSRSFQTSNRQRAYSCGIVLTCSPLWLAGSTRCTASSSSGVRTCTGEAKRTAWRSAKTHPTLPSRERCVHACAFPVLGLEREWMSYSSRGRKKYLLTLSNFPSSLTRNITSHSMETLAFHSLLRSQMIILPILTASPLRFSLGKLGECTFRTWKCKG